MDKDLLTKCMRLEFDDAPYRHFNEDIEKSTEVKYKTYEDFDEFDDDEDSVSLDDEDIAVIDTDFDSKSEEETKPIKYVGKYIVVCPICLNPLFSDNESGEVHCPVCDQDVDIESAVGKVTEVPEDSESSGDEEGASEGELINDLEFDDGGKEFATEEGEEEVVKEESVDTNKIKVKPSRINHNNTKKLSKNDLKESVNDIIELGEGEYDFDEDSGILYADGIDANIGEYVKVKFTDNNDDAVYTYKVTDVVSVDNEKYQTELEYVGDDSEEQLGESFEDEHIGKSDEDSSKDEKTESVTVNVCPEGSVSVTSSEADTTVEVAPTTKDEGSEPTEYTNVDDEDCCINEEDISEIDEFDEESFDDQVTNALTSIYQNDDIEYESTKINLSKNGGVLIEGTLKSNGTTTPTKFYCSKLTKDSKFRVEGLPNLTGCIFTECKYNKDKKHLKFESMKYKFMDKSHNKVYRTDK